MDGIKPRKLNQRSIKQKALSVPADKTIAKSKLTQSLNSLNPRLRKQTNFAKTLRGVRK